MFMLRLAAVAVFAVAPPTILLTLAAVGALRVGDALGASCLSIAIALWLGRAYLFAEAFERLDEHGQEHADPFTAAVEDNLRRVHAEHRAGGCTRVSTAAEYEQVARDLDGVLHELADLVEHAHEPSTLDAEALMHLRWARQRARRLAAAAALREATRS